MLRLLATKIRLPGQRPCPDPPERGQQRDYGLRCTRIQEGEHHQQQHAVQQRLEKLEAGAVQVRVVQRNRRALHLHDQHVRVVGADVVLQQKPLAVAGGRGVESRVVELEWRGAVQAAHESFDVRSIGRLQLPDVGAADLFARQTASQTIELLVQVHDQQVKAVPVEVVTVVGTCCFGLSTQVQRLGVGVICVGSRGLQNRQVQLQAVVGDQRGLDPGGPQEGARTHGGDSVGFLHRSLFPVRRGDRVWAARMTVSRRTANSAQRLDLRQSRMRIRVRFIRDPTPGALSHRAAASTSESGGPSGGRNLLLEIAPSQDFQDVASCKNVKVLGDVRAQRKFGPLMFVECGHLADRHVACRSQRGDDPLLVGLLVVRGRHGEVFNVRMSPRP
jgi:hypothetical protein